MAYDASIESVGGAGQAQNTAKKTQDIRSKSATSDRSSESGPKPNSGLNSPGGAASPIIGATALLAAKYPSHFTGKNDQRSRIESRVVTIITMFIIGFIVYGWTQWSEINFLVSFDFTYNSGLVGGILMLLTLTYALRKRINWLRKWGGMEGWYYFHLIGGVFGPIVIIFHTSFSLRSINSTMAFVAMMFVVVSGLFGRYIYTRIGYGLHRKINAIRDTEAVLIESIRKYQSSYVDVIERRLSTFALACLAGPQTIAKIPLRFVSIRTAAATCYVTASEDLIRMLKTQAQEEGWGVRAYKNILDVEKKLLREHINAVVDIAHVHIYERLLVRWRILHIPLLYILFITGCAHVLAVHMY